MLARHKRQISVLLLVFEEWFYTTESCSSIVQYGLSRAGTSRHVCKSSEALYG